MKSETVILNNRFPEIIDEADEQAAEVILLTLMRIEDSAKGYSRVDTGNMRGGWQHEMIADLAGITFNIVHYTLHNEFGTVYMAPQPMAVPAAEDAREQFVEEMMEIYG